MKNLYLLHSNPEQLFGYDTANYRIPELAYQLAKEKPELRKQLEPVIMKAPSQAVYYALYVLRRPWPEAEPYIMKDPQWAYGYARDVLKRPWPEAEQYIMKDPYWASKYLKFKAKFK